MSLAHGMPEGDDVVHTDAERLRAVITGILTGHGVPADDAATVVDNLVEADLRGVDSHGAHLVALYVALGHAVGEAHRVSAAGSGSGRSRPKSSMALPRTMRWMASGCTPANSFSATRLVLGQVPSWCG